MLTIKQIAQAIQSKEVKAKKATAKRWELLSVKQTEVHNGRRIKSVPTTLMKMAVLVGSATVKEVLDQRIEYLTTPNRNIVFEMEWAYTTKHWA